MFALAAEPVAGLAEWRIGVKKHKEMSRSTWRWQLRRSLPTGWAFWGLAAFGQPAGTNDFFFAGWRALDVVRHVVAAAFVPLGLSCPALASRSNTNPCFDGKDSLGGKAHCPEHAHGGARG